MTQHHSTECLNGSGNAVIVHCGYTGKLIVSVQVNYALCSGVRLLGDVFSAGYDANRACILLMGILQAKRPSYGYGVNLVCHRSLTSSVCQRSLTDSVNSERNSWQVIVFHDGATV
jgi:hypothetical protein